ncbi:hypothetical protein O1611_g559 [Lasiodiplodia mahajangana]|uniref:Uncharacterized protein n=1 Tax=Lasiodiplodia mahajangana TaxID=1108764 RepID=A0ACC2K019_9PEZI|nr:hypothetical protein O1611_g559 [Lasiodiplodia mahajangana]
MVPAVFLLYLLLVTIIYEAAVVIYRIYFHSLAQFPGPKLAAATELYEMYFDLLQGPGGPIVRINPNELHVEDSAWFSTLYVNSGSGIRDKYPPAAAMLGTPGGGFGTVSHKTHQKRRGAISPCFSKSAVAASESMIYDHVDKLIGCIDKQILLEGSAELRVIYLALTTDILMEHCFGESTCSNLIENNDKAREWSRVTTTVVDLTNIGKRIGWMIPYAMKCPLRMLTMISPSVAKVLKLRHDLEAQADLASRIYSKHKGGEVDIDEASCVQERKMLFQNILSSKSLPDADKSPGRMSQEAFEVIMAGVETTSRSLTAATYYVLSKPESVLLRLQEELRDAVPEPDSRIPLKQLETLPWLTAVIKEALRVVGVTTARMPLISPRSPLLYKDWVLPPGTAVSMTVRDLLIDSDVFDAPLEFRPERWLPTNPELQQLNRNWQPFSRGSRMCVGMNLAMAQLYITIASVFRRRNFGLYDTIWARDIQIIDDKAAFDAEVGAYCTLNTVESLRGRIPKCYGIDFDKRAVYLQRINEPCLRLALPDESTLRQIKQRLLETIGIIHEHGWCHGDINLDNMFASGVLFDFSHAHPKSKLSAEAWEDFQKQDRQNVRSCYYEALGLKKLEAAIALLDSGVDGLPRQLELADLLQHSKSSPELLKKLEKIADPPPSLALGICRAFRRGGRPDSGMCWLQKPNLPIPCDDETRRLNVRIQGEIALCQSYSNDEKACRLYADAVRSSIDLLGSTDELTIGLRVEYASFLESSWRYSGALDVLRALKLDCKDLLHPWKERIPQMEKQLRYKRVKKRWFERPMPEEHRLIEDDKENMRQSEPCSPSKKRKLMLESRT